MYNVIKRLWILISLVFVQHVPADVQRRVYINGDSGQNVILTDGETITITPSQTYDIFCSGSRYAKHWYRESDLSKSPITRLSKTTTSPDVYAINTESYVLTLQFRPFQSTHAGEYECGFTSSGQTLTPLSVFLTPAPTPPPPPIPSKVQGVTVTRTVQGSSPALRVSWSAVSGSGITYTVCYSTTSGTQSYPPSNANCSTSGITGTSTTLGPLSRRSIYHIWVGAASSDRKGPYSDRRQNLTYNVPGPITSLQIRRSTTIFGLIITWGPPSGSNYPTPLTYQLRYRERPSSGSPGGWSRTVQRTATQRQYTTPVLKPGSRYEVEVWAVTSMGKGQSFTRTATTYQLPGPVISLQVRPSTTIFGLIITWGPPSGSNYPTHVTYRLRYRQRPSSGSPGGWSSTVQRTATQRQYTTPVLKPGTRYEVEAWAVSSMGRGQSVTRTATTYQLPGPVTSLQVRPSTTIFGLIITWGLPSGSNYPTRVTYQLRYRQRPSSGSPGGWSRTVQRTATQRQYTTPVLKPGTRYEVEVWTVSSVGNGQSILRTASIRQLPGPVASLQVRPSTTTFGLIITWGPPSGSNYPTPVTYQLRYRERPSSGSPGGWSSTVQGTAIQRQYATPALKPASRYEVEVWTFVSGMSGPVRTIFGPTASGAVQELNVRLHSTQTALVITWRPPSDITNPTGYRLRYRKTSSSTWSSTRTIGSQQTQYTITGLEEGATYEVELWATFRSGEGSRRKVTATTTTIQITAVTTHSITMVPSPPSGTVYYKEVGSSAQPRRVPYSNTVTITQLQPNTNYSITYRIGNGLGVNRTDMNQSTLPNAVSHLKLSVVSSKSVNITWKEPEHSNSLMYHVNYSFRMSKSNTSISPKSTTQTLTGLHPFEEYTISVQAGNRAGLSVPVTGTVLTYSDVPEGQPRSLRSVTNGSTWIHVAWDIPLVGGRNGIIISYMVEVSPNIGNVTIRSPNPTFSTPELITYNITGLSPGTEYTLRVAASTVNGTGPFSAGSQINTRPGPVRNLTFEVVPSGTVTINWVQPSVSNGMIVAYELIYAIIGEESMSARKRSNSEAKTNLKGLEPEKPYTVTVRAYTSAGPGENQTIIVFASEGVPLKSVDNIIVKRRPDHSVIVTWTTLSYTEAKGFPFYIVTYAAFDGCSSGNTTSISDSAVLVGLNPGIGCKICVEVTTGNGANRGNDTSTVTCATLSPQSFPVGAVVGVLLALILVGALVAVVVVIYLCCKRSQACTSCQSREVAPKSSRKKKKKADMYEMQPSPEETYYLSLQVGSMEPIPQSSFSIHVKAMHMERDSGFEREFQTIANDPAGSEEIAIENRPKNRYLNIHTFDHSRVVLSGNKESDYINASFIDGYQRSNAYIASQGPLPNTIADFWEMVWEQRSPVIVMLTKLEEKGKVKCEKYWNDELDTPYDLSRNLTVTTRSYKAMADYEIRDIRVVKANGSRNKPLDVVQMQYNGWPDYGVPSHPSSLVKFVQQVRKEYKNSTAPMLVHCSAGVGRTGTFITIDAMLERLQEKDDLNVYQFVTAMRSQRTFMVQTMDQYAFIHDALNDHLTCGDTSVPAHHLRSVIAEMSGLHQETSSTGFEEQFEFLDSLCKKTCDEDDTYSRKGTITKKNRYSDKFPYSYNHLKLHSKTNTNGGDYINASFVDSYSKSKAFIAAQAPLENTKNDIWQLIWQYKMPTVVVLCDFQEDNEETCCKFWPDEVNRSNEFDYLKVNHKDVSYADSYEMIKLDVFDKSMESKVHNVTLFHTTSWPKNGPVDPNSVLKLMGDVEGAHGGKKKPIFVLCDDGMGRSGAFICAMSEVERVKVEGEVDVFQTVKAMRSQRPHMVDTPEQYKLCFEILLTHLDSFDTYANFKAV